jgi:hypothetical protein
MTELNYHPELKGGCAGIAQMGIQAFLADEIDVFNERIVLIHQIWEKIELLKKSKQGDELYQDTKYKKLITQLKNPDILAFFDGFQLYQQPREYKQIIGHYVSQYKPATLSTVTTSKKIMDDGGLFQLDHYFSQFTISEIKSFLILLQKHAGKSKIAMSFSSNEHRIGVCFDGRVNKWLLIDANQLPIHEVSLENLSERIFAAHSINGPMFDSLPISVRVYAVGKEQKNITTVLDALKEDKDFTSLQIITLEKAQQTNKDKDTLLHLAARYGHQQSTSNILDAMMIDADVKNKDNKTPLYIAASHGHDNVVNELLKKKHHTKPYLACNDKTNPITIAAMRGHLSTLTLFSNYQKDLFKPDGTGKNAMDYAKQNKHQHIINFLNLEHEKKQKLQAIVKKQKPQTIADHRYPLRKHSIFSTSLAVEPRPKLNASNQPPKKRIKYNP